MTVRPIAHIGDPVLRAGARPVAPEELATPAMQGLIDDMIDTMRAAGGAGIAAPQVGESVRIAVIEINDNPRYPYKPNAPLTVIVNPELTVIGDETYANNEGCLSVPDLRGDLLRHVSVHIAALDRQGNPFQRSVKGLTAGTYQHEVDHLNGTIFVDRVEDSRSLSTWEQFRVHHQADFVDRITKFVAEVGS